MVDWMGRYRNLVSALVQHSNVVSKAGNERHYMYDGIYMTSNEWQVLEYIVEQRNQDERMILMSETLGIPQSSFSKIIKSMSSLGLVERYRSIDNKKNVIIKPTPLALKVYDYHVNQRYDEVFKPFFDALEGISAEDLNTVTRAIEILSNGILRSQQDPAARESEEEEKKKPNLIRID